MATKYVSALTGPQMDSALLDMANHNSEAYAVGERGGVAVSAGDVTYHNNAKYYASQTGADAQAAETAAARAEAAVPSGTAGAVFFDRAQSLTTAQQSQARANIMAGGSNDNLLDNWYFVGGGSQLGDGVFPINQRGQTQYAGGGGIKGLDRWKIGYPDGTITLNENGLTLNAYKWLFQPLRKEVYEGIEGEIVTASVLTADGNLYTGTNTFTQNADVHFTWIIPGGENLELRTSKYSGAPSFQIVNYSPSAGTEMTIVAVKLEKGSYSTLLNDAQPDFWGELAKCQRYLYIPTFPWYAWTGTVAMATSATDFNWVINTPVPMRQGVIPTIGITGSVYINNTAVSNLTIGNYPVGNLVKISGTSAGMTNGQLYPVNTSGANVSVILSAEP